MQVSVIFDSFPARLPATGSKSLWPLRRPVWTLAANDSGVDQKQFEMTV
jgi:hypothetical protein